MTLLDPAQPDTTFGAEDSLPRVPLPTLADSCARFLEWSSPLLTAEQFAETRRAVDDFLAPSSPAHALHQSLVAYDARPDVDSWLDEFWRQRYLGRRVRTAVNANFFFLFANVDTDQFRRAAGLVMGALRHKADVDTERFPVTRQRNTPLSMEQHKYLFSSTRIPGIDRDHARTPYSAQEPGPSTARHVLVIADGHLFALDVIGPEGVPHTLDQISAALSDIASRAAAEHGPGVGSLTSLDRADWARARARLLEFDADNPAIMDVIERALFAVVLESEPAADQLAAADRLLIGDSGNRWFDKSLTFIVLPDGRAGVNGEHCCLDGTTITELLDAILPVADTEHERAAGARRQEAPSVRPLTFALDDALRNEITGAAAAFDKFAGNTTGRIVELSDFGAAIPKSLGVSPDAFVQLAYQLAHRRVKGLIGATYESISLRRYHHGRTEAMRVVTPEIVEFVEAMEDPATDVPTRAAAARTAATAHVQRAKDCQAVLAPEQHLWELQMIAQREDPDAAPLALYTSPGWVIMRDDYLSTSSVPSVNIEVFGFGATSGHCIGVGYLLLNDLLRIYLSTPTPIAAEMERFAAELPRAIADLTAVLEAPTDGDEG